MPKSNPQSSTPKPTPPLTLPSLIMAAHPANCSMPKPCSYPFFLSPLLQDLKSRPAVNPVGRNVKISLEFDHLSPPLQPGKLQSMGSQRVIHDRATKHSTRGHSTAATRTKRQASLQQCSAVHSFCLCPSIEASWCSNLKRAFKLCEASHPSAQCYGCSQLPHLRVASTLPGVAWHGQHSFLASRA